MSRRRGRSRRSSYGGRSGRSPHVRSWARDKRKNGKWLSKREYKTKTGRTGANYFKMMGLKNAPDKFA